MFQVVAKTIFDFNFHPAINHDPLFGKGMKLSRRSPTQSRYTGKRDFQRIQTSLSIITCAKVLSKVAASGKTIGPWAFRTVLNRGNSKQFPGQHDICMLPDSEFLTAKLDGSVGRNCSVSAHPSTQRPSCYPFNTALSKGLLNAAPKVKLFKELGSFLMSGKAAHGNPSTHVSSQKRFTRAPRCPRVSGRTSSTKMNGKSVGRLVDDVPCRLETNFLKLPAYEVSTSYEMSSDLCMGGGSQVSICFGRGWQQKTRPISGLGSHAFSCTDPHVEANNARGTCFENSDPANSEQEKT